MKVATNRREIATSEQDLRQLLLLFCVSLARHQNNGLMPGQEVSWLFQAGSRIYVAGELGVRLRKWEGAATSNVCLEVVGRAPVFNCSDHCLSNRFVEGGEYAGIWTPPAQGRCFIA